MMIIKWRYPRYHKGIHKVARYTSCLDDVEEFDDVKDEEDHK